MGMKKKDGKRSQTKIAFSSMQVPREAVVENSNVSSSKLSSSYPLSDFTVDNSTYSSAQIRAAFYPKFENEKSDQEIRIRMIEVVSNGLATMEVSLKHSGSLFMYAGHKGGAFAKNSYGNKYTAVGVFVLGQMFREAWGRKAGKKQAKFNDFLERNSMCVSMELVTAVLGDHGQRPREDYVVVTAVTELGNGKPKFYSTPDIIAFCRKWRLPTNHVWLFSTRKSVTSFFAAYDALCEEGTATSVCKAIDEVSDISIPGSKDHVKVQGEILEGLVARIVSRESFNHMENVMRNFPPPRAIGAGLDLGPSLREIYAANRSNEKEQLKVLLQNVGSSFCPDNVDWFRDARSKEADQSVISFFLQAHPADYSTAKLQEIIRLMRKRSSGGSYEFKCYSNFHKLDSSSADNLHFKVIVHIKRDKFFQQYQKEMRNNPGVWPIYRGFFVDINLFKANNEGAADIVKNVDNNSSSGTSGMDGLADEDENLMLKLKFVPYMLRTFLIRNGLSILLKNGQDAYKTYYLKQLKKWGTSPRKKRQLSEMLDEWAGYIKRKYEKKESIGILKEYYLSEAEPFLEQYAKRSSQNQALVGCAGNLVRVEDILAIVEEDGDEEGVLETQMVVAPSSPNHSVKEDVGLIVFFPGIPGCAKSALCKEIVCSPEALGDDRPVKSMMGDLVKGKYWQKLANERVKKPYSIMLADKNAPNEEVWTHIEDICQTTKAAAVPVIPDSEGTESNPFSLDVLAVFMFRVLQRVNHPGKLDKNCLTAGYVLLMFYHLYEGKTRQEFESELIESFGSLVKIPVLKSKRHPLPDQVKCVMEEGIKLYKRHFHKHGRNDCTKGTLANDWVKWEKKLRETLFGHAQYLNSIQVPFDSVLKQVVEQLKTVAKGEYKIPNSGKRKLGSIVYAAVSIPVKELQSFLYNMAKGNKEVESFFKHKNLVASLRKAHVTLAHKKSRGVAAVASYAVFLHGEVPVEIIALLFSDKMAALEVRLGSIDGETISSKNAWPHITLWTAKGVSANDANMLPELFSEGKAIRIDINPVVSILGTLEFF